MGDYRRHMQQMDRAMEQVLRAAKTLEEVARQLEAFKAACAGFQSPGAAHQTRQPPEGGVIRFFVASRSVGSIASQPDAA
jgi:hypothetical protein